MSAAPNHPAVEPALTPAPQTPMLNPHAPQDRDPPRPMTDQQTQQNWFTLPRILFWILVILFFSLQLRLWIGDGSLAEVWQLNNAIERQQTENRLLEERNKRLRAEVKNLKEGLDAVEERARTQLGMIKEDETFFLIKEDNTPKSRTP